MNFLLLAKSLSPFLVTGGVVGTGATIYCLAPDLSESISSKCLENPKNWMGEECRNNTLFNEKLKAVWQDN
ncbi:hypothetical protein MHLP_03885 [Candidatus Mycoplasma haematolamae str. Purdue]|uniref:Uncharacterized protein n=1 Tax=Mycoplasma haematolamae (strain Purdue) TaxID=1212765 RepID=I7C721_MYCHA|nr:hypothetical protein [Candidatus Mycoplasma haematolamae]AFO52357.1 hypothetical protein MHLP_03885 [Candidatus Mycoplasma haematolamae str. Purdue]